MNKSYVKSEAIAKSSLRSIAGGVVSINRKVEPPIVFVRAQGDGDDASDFRAGDGGESIPAHDAFGERLDAGADAEGDLRRKFAAQAREPFAADVNGALAVSLACAVKPSSFS